MIRNTRNRASSRSGEKLVYERFAQQRGPPNSGFAGDPQKAIVNVMPILYPQVVSRAL